MSSMPVLLLDRVTDKIFASLRAGVWQFCLPMEALMSVLTFKAADVRRVVEHSISNKQAEVADWSTANEANNWTPKTSVPAEPRVVLVHDQGVYLMSNGTPRDTIK